MKHEILDRFIKMVRIEGWEVQLGGATWASSKLYLYLTNRSLPREDLFLRNVFVVQHRTWPQSQKNVISKSAKMCNLGVLKGWKGNSYPPFWLQLTSTLRRYGLHHQRDEIWSSAHREISTLRWKNVTGWRAWMMCSDGSLIFRESIDSVV